MTKMKLKMTKYIRKPIDFNDLYDKMFYLDSGDDIISYGVWSYTPEESDTLVVAGPVYKKVITYNSTPTVTSEGLFYVMSIIEKAGTKDEATIGPYYFRACNF